MVVKKKAVIFLGGKIREAIENIYYVVIGMAWTFFFAKLSFLLFGESVEIEVLGLLCGTSISVLIIWALKYLTFELRKQIASAKKNG